MNPPDLKRGNDAKLIKAQELFKSKTSLRYVSDSNPGIQRVYRRGKFTYLDTYGSPITDLEVLRRIQSLAIPPAWKNVWICPSPEGHLQATGRDARGRKQYRYHPGWHRLQDETKFARMLEFGKSLPRIRAQVEKDLSSPGLSKRKVVATVVRLLETTFMRVGNEEYARHNNSFGLTTLRDKHVAISRTLLRFRFRGKRGIVHDIALEDKRIANIVKQCRDIPGAELFQYIDQSGEVHSLDSGDVNAYLREVTNSDFSAKDFRTWAGTLLAALALREFKQLDKKVQNKKNILRAIEKVAAQLGNTLTICKKCYIHPAIFDHYLEGSLVSALDAELNAQTKNLEHLRREEVAVMKLLSRRVRGDSKHRSAG